MTLDRWGQNGDSGLGRRVAVIGGGLAGGIAATHLARAGFEVVLFEKEKGPSGKVCGEFISAEGVPYLEEIGVDLNHLGATYIDRLHFHGPHFSFATRLPTVARGLSRSLLDEIVLTRAMDAGCVVRRGERVKDLQRNKDGFRVLSAESETLAGLVVLATGKHDFRKVQSRTGRDSGLVGYKIHIRPTPRIVKRLERTVELFVFRDGYGGLSLVEGGSANLCFLVAKGAVRDLGGDVSAVLDWLRRGSRELRECLEGCEPVESRFHTVANIPYGFILNQEIEDELFCVGDQCAVIPSLTGDGMTIAMMTGREAVRSILESSDRARSKRFQRHMARSLRPRIHIGYMMHALFRSPPMSDVASAMMGRAPWLARCLFSATRCPAPATI